MNWKNLNQLPHELIDKNILLRIVPRNGNPDVIVMGCVDEDGNIYTDTQFESNLGGRLSRDYYKTIYYIDTTEIKL